MGSFVLLMVSLCRSGSVAHEPVTQKIGHPPLAHGNAGTRGRDREGKISQPASAPINPNSMLAARTISKLMVVLGGNVGEWLPQKILSLA